MQKNKFSGITTLLFALTICILYILGTLLPDIFWGTHFLAFTSPILKYVLLITIPIFFIFIFYQRLEKINFKLHLNNTTTIVITILSAIIFYNLDIANDYYGDAKNFSPYLDQKLTEIKRNFWKELFSIQFITGHARWGVFKFYSLISYVLKINMFQTFKLMGAFWGAGFIYVWISIVRKFTRQNTTTILFLILGCSSPVALNFCGHIETYGFILFLLISWFYLLITAVTERNKTSLWALIPLFIICARFSTPSILLFPALLLVFIQHYSPKSWLSKSLFSIKKMSKYILTPLVIIGVLAYFFIFKDYNDSRILNTDTRDIDRLFLPLLSPPAPLDNYNLFSWNHIFDFLMSLFFWSPAIIFLICILILYRKKIDWSNPLINIILLTFILFLGFLFMINPLMSLPMDWDLYTLPFPIISILILLIFQNQSLDFIKNKVTLYALGLHILAMPIFIVLINKTMHSYRIESIGVRVYKTYYQHSDNYLLLALQMLEGDKIYATRKNQLLKKLKPFVKKPIDKSYAALLLDEGINTFANKQFKKSRKLLLDAYSYAPSIKLTHEYIMKVNQELISQGFDFSNKHKVLSDSLFNIGLKKSREQKLYKESLSYFESASFYNPINLNIDLFQMEAYFLVKDFNRALIKAEKLALEKYPDEKQSLRFSIHCALEAEAYDKALFYSNRYLLASPKDKFIRSIYDKLTNNENLSELKYKFEKIEK